MGERVIPALLADMPCVNAYTCNLPMVLDLR